MKTKTFSLLGATGVLPLAAGCASVSSRISKNRGVYESWPMEVREKVAAGQIDVGLTPEQVRVALARIIHTLFGADDDFPSDGNEPSPVESSDAG